MAAVPAHERDLPFHPPPAASRPANAAGWPAAPSLLVLHDLTPQADHAAWRAGMIARDLGTDVHLLGTSRDPARLDRDKPVLDRLAAAMAAQLGVQVRVRFLQGDPAAAVVQADAGLVVMAGRRPDVMREWLSGSPAERLIRLCGRPVLVVRNPAASGYRRVLVPVDLGTAATPALAAAVTLSRAPPIDVFHSLAIRDDVTLRADVPEVVVRQRRRGNIERARTRLAELIAAVPDARHCAQPSIGFGHAPSMVLARAQALRADLVVVGRQRRGRLADFLLGSVTQRLLAAGRSDVLVLPDPSRPAKAISGLVGVPA